MELYATGIKLIFKTDFPAKFSAPQRLQFCCHVTYLQILKPSKTAFYLTWCPADGINFSSPLFKPIVAQPIRRKLGRKEGKL